MLTYQSMKQSSNIMRVFTSFLTLFVLPLSAYAQSYDTLRLCTYNVSELSGESSNLSAFRSILTEIHPDILVCQDVVDNDGVAMLLNAALNIGIVPEYSAVSFNDGPGTDNALYYNFNTIDVVRAEYHSTISRNIAEYVIVPKGTTDTIHLFSAHLTEGSDSMSMNQRIMEAGQLRLLMGERSGGHHYSAYRNPQLLW